jgi:predicted metal-dependent peptidase
MSLTRNESLSKVCKELMLKEPYYGLFLVMTEKEWSEEIPTAGVAKHNINYKLRINPEFWDTLSLDHRIGLTKHEMLHLAFFHPLMRDSFQDAKLFNIAADMEINQYIEDQYLPEGGIKLDSFPGIVFPEKAGTRTYYDILSQNQNNQTLQNLMDAMGQGQPQSEDGLDNPNHDWEEFEGMSDAEKRLMQTQMEYQMKELAEEVKKSRGTVPGEIKELIKNFNVFEQPKFDWKGYIRRFIGRSVKVYTKKLRRKFNKRFEDNPGLKIKQKKHILVAVDTSGSVSTDELKEFFSEVHHMHKTGCDVTVVQCDTAISDIRPYKQSNEIALHGRGGTSFEPVIEYYDANQKKYTCLIYFTDGEAPAPAKPRGHILWVLSSRCSMNNKLPGQIIKLN